MSIERKLKPCCGCEKPSIIWRRVKGKGYCRTCWQKESLLAAEPTERTTLPNSRKPIASRSAKRALEEKQYSEIRKKFLNQYPMCQAKIVIDCCITASQVHHKAGRIGKLLCDTNHFLAVCHPCHEYIELHKKESIQLGFSELRLKK